MSFLVAMQPNQGDLGIDLGLKRLARLAACSKEFERICQENACYNAASLIDHELNAARNGVAQQEQHKPAIAWLTAVATDPAMARIAHKAAEDVAEKMLSMESVPMDRAAQMVAAGQRVTYAQLLAAAKRMVPGVEVWVQAQQREGAVTDIPAIAVAICSGGNWLSCATATVITLPACNAITWSHSLSAYGSTSGAAATTPCNV
jgi:hypothetical protein